MEIDIKQVAKIKVEPGEVLLFELGRDYHRSVIDNINDSLQKIFKENKVIVVPYDMLKSIKHFKVEEQKK